MKSTSAIVEKAHLQYAGIPVIVAALLILRAGRLDVYTLLSDGLILAFGYIAAIIDLKAKRIPNGLLIVMLSAWAALAVFRVFFDTDAAVEMLKGAGYGAAAGGGLFMLVYIISRKGLGGGDVKFMACTGLYLGFSGTITVMLCGCVLAALTGLTLIILKKIGRKDTIPLVPFLYIGILPVCFIA